MLEDLLDEYNNSSKKELKDLEEELGDVLHIRGPKGEKGDTPIKGEDYFTNEEVFEFKKEVTPIKGVDYFDGLPGYTPVKGKDYFDGQPGYTPVKGIDYFDGETPEINTPEIALQASKLAQVELEKLIPSLIPVSEPFSLSDTDIENISLDVQSQIVPNLNKEIEDLKKGFSTFKPTGGNTEVFQNGAKVGSGQALNFIGATVTHDGHMANITVTGGDLSEYVPYTGATADVDLGIHHLTAIEIDTRVIHDTSGTGLELRNSLGGMVMTIGGPFGGTNVLGNAWSIDGDGSAVFTFLSDGVGTGFPIKNNFSQTVVNFGDGASLFSTFSGRIDAPLGTALLPTYTFTGDLNTGIWSSAPDTLNFSTGGVERMRVNSSGNVGIGATTVSYPLHIEKNVNNSTGAVAMVKNLSSGDSATAEFRAENNLNYSSRVFKLSSGYTTYKNLTANSAGWYNDTNGGNLAILNDSTTGKITMVAGGRSSTGDLVVDTTGNIGIGTTTPNEKLDVMGNIRLSDATNALIKWPTVGATTIAGLDFFRQGDWGSRLQVATSSGDLVFYDTGGAAIERFRIGRASGNVTVGGALASQNLQLGLTTSSGISTVAAQYYPGSTKADVLTFKTFSSTGDSQYSRLTLTSGSGGSPGTADVRVDNANLIVNGNVGIGTTTPSKPLDVIGTARIGTGTGYGGILDLVTNSASMTTLLGITSAGKASWGINLGTEAVPNVYIGLSEAGAPGGAAGGYFWRANWNNAGVAVNTFRQAAGASALTTLNVLTKSGQTGDLLAVSTAAGTMGDLLKVQANGNVGIGTPTPLALLQVGAPTASHIIGNTPITRIIGSGNSASSETLLRLARKGVDATYYPAVVDFNMLSFDPAGAPNYGPGTQLNINLKSTGSWTETADVTVMALRDNGNVGIGTTTPVGRLDVISTGEQFRAGYSATQYWKTTTGITGTTTFDAFGTNPFFTFNDYIYVNVSPYTATLCGGNGGTFTDTVNTVGFANTSNAGYFANSTLSVTLVDSTYAINATGNVKIAGTTEVSTGGLYVYGLNSSPYDNGALFEAGGKGGFNDGLMSVYFTDGTYAINAVGPTIYANGNFAAYHVTASEAAAYNDLSNNVYMCDGTNAINATGNVKMQGLSSGAGAPATILTNFNLYVDTTTGIVYVD